MWIKILCIEYILWRIYKTKSMFDVANMLINFTVENVPINIYELLNMQAFNVEFGCTPKHPNSSGKLLVLTVPQISTRVSSYSQAMVF